jgi:hypothetical protein
MKRLLLYLTLFACAAAAHGQLRSIPKEAPRGTIRHVQEMIVDIDGTQRRLAQGAQIRDAGNRIVVPTAIPAGTLVRYELDKDGLVLGVWFLTPEEAKAN